VTLEAEAHALMGDERATLRAMDEAEAIMDRSADEDASRRPRVAFFNRAYLAGERGVALARLDKSQDAQEVLASALASLNPEAMKTRPRLLTALATAHVRQGNIEEACQLGTDALGLATKQEVGPNLQDVRKLRVELEPWRDSSPVRSLDERLALAG
jgi:tetratricopeptide (TPR) repeat protein